MTEKRFNYSRCEIFENGEHFAYACSEYNAEDISNKLNELVEENEELRKQLDETIDGLHKQITTSENAFEGLMKENKELRQKQQEMRVLLTKIEREFRERGILTEEEFMRLLE